MHVLHERDREVAVLHEAVRAARAGSGAVVVVEGEPGIGKTALLAAAAAGAAGAVVLRARGGELERDCGFGVARQLFEPLLRRAPPARRELLLHGAASSAAALLGFGGPPGDVFAVQHGLYWLLDALAAEAPVVLIVDDAQWVDVPSLQWLVHAARRLDGVRAALLIGSRTGGSGARGEALAVLRGEPVCRTLQPAVLSEVATSVLVRRSLGPTASDELCLACHRSSGGNPFLLEQLLTEMGPSDTPEVVHRISAPGVRRSVERRLAALPPSAAALAAAVAVLGNEARSDAAAALAGLQRSAAAEAAAALQSAGLLAEEEPLRFAHPVLQSAVYSGLPDARRRALHAGAAELLDSDPARAAMHLLLAPRVGSTWAVERLREAARLALERGAPASAAELLVRALEESASPTAELLFDLGVAERQAGLAGSAVRLAAALDASDDSRFRLRAITELVLALLFSDRPAEGRARLESEMTRTGTAGAPPPLRLEALRLALATNALAPGAPPVTPAGDVDDDDPDAPVLLSFVLGHHLVRCDVPLQQLEPLITRAWIPGRSSRGVLGASWAYPITACAALDDLDRAESIASAVLAEGRLTGDVPVQMSAGGFRGWLALCRGDLPAAEVDLRAALPEPSRPRDAGLTLALAHLVRVLVHKGDAAAAHDLLVRYGADRVELSSTAQGRTLRHSRAVLALAQARFADALADADEHQAQFRAAGSPGWPIGVRLVAAEARRRLGDADTARALVEEELDLARRLGYRSSEGAALRAAGVLDRDVDLLAESVEVLTPLPRRLELARSLITWGSALRRARRPLAARDVLRRGLDAAAECGSGLLVELARAEVLAAGGRPRRPRTSGIAALTPTERRVAELAAAGASNPAIAQELFVTRKTVESHLAATYRKLGITTRTELPAALRARR